MTLRHFGRTWFLAACAAALLFGCRGNESKEQPPANSFQLAENEKLPDFTLPDLAGRPINLRHFEGKKIVVLNLWATWCGPCRQEIPDFNAAYEAFKGRDVEFLGVSVDQDAAEVVPLFLQKLPISYTVLLGSPELTFRYGVRGIPTTFVINKSGRVQRRFVGKITRKTLEQELERLM